MSENLTQLVAETASLGWFKQLGCAVHLGTQLASGGSVPGRELFSDVLMVALLCEAMHQLKSETPLRAIATLWVALLTELLRVANIQTSRGITQ